MTTMERAKTLRFAWLYVTDLCQLSCTHCATGSSPQGTHGTMTTEDWKRVIDELAALGVPQVQIVGGEPMLLPALGELIEHALSRAVAVEVFSNLVHVPDALWPVLQQPGVSLATSYYSDDAGEHNAITGRPSHARTEATIAKARELGIPLRAGVIDMGTGQRVDQARDRLVGLGVPRIGQDQVRELGRAAADGCGGADQLCGHCGDGVAAVDPTGNLRACLFAKGLSAGNVNGRPLADLVPGLAEVRAELIAAGMPATVGARACAPDGDTCYPIND